MIVYLRTKICVTFAR